jgi:hypothetical protein
MHLGILLGDRYCPSPRSPRYRPSSPRSTSGRRCTRTEEHVLDQSLRDSWDYKEPDPTWDVGGHGRDSVRGVDVEFGAFRARHQRPMLYSKVT